MSEFNLINRYFRELTPQRDDVALGIGDDCAITCIPVGKYLATSTDTLISGVHFPACTRAVDIGYKSLAVNLSDLAAMGAEPAWVSLALTLPEQNSSWLEDFSNGFSQLASHYGVQLIGGDTTRGDLSISVQIFGFVNPDKFLRRDRARSDDLIYVSGNLGDAGLGLQCALNQLEVTDALSNCVRKLNRPTPQVELGRVLTEVSQCAIDISDGLAADLQHILDESQCAAIIEVENIPLSRELLAHYGASINWKQVITSGDDYELCFTIAPMHKARLEAIATNLDIKVTQIGVIKEGEGLRFKHRDGDDLRLDSAGYNHFL